MDGADKMYILTGVFIFYVCRYSPLKQVSQAMSIKRQEAMCKLKDWSILTVETVKLGPCLKHALPQLSQQTRHANAKWS